MAKRASLVVGFDLDLTLVDARAGIVATYRELAARTGVPVDAELAVARLGLPLREEIANWFPSDRVDAGVALYRDIYQRHGASCQAMPGAAAAVAAVRESNHGRTVVITSKLGRFARAHLDHLGIKVDLVIGDRFGEGKTAAMVAEGVQVYVGDHVADVHSARAAGAIAVGVATGPCRPPDLHDAGAHTVLADLHEFPAWLATRLPRTLDEMPK